MNPALIRLLQLSSPALPVGAYTYSQGLEWAVDAGGVTDEPSTLAWIDAALRQGMARCEAVYLAHMASAWTTVLAEGVEGGEGGDGAIRDEVGAPPSLQQLNMDFVVSRETAELRAETLQMGYSLRRLLQDLPGFPADAVLNFESPSFPLVWSYATVVWSVPVADAVAAYLWAWAENQVMAAVKAVPLGQTAGQKLLLALGERIPALAADARATVIDDAANYLPGLAIASSRHETQYTRLFRS